MSNLANYTSKIAYICENENAELLNKFSKFAFRYLISTTNYLRLGIKTGYIRLAM